MIEHLPLHCNEWRSCLYTWPVSFFERPIRSATDTSRIRTRFFTWRVLACFHLFWEKSRSQNIKLLLVVEWPSRRCLPITTRLYRLPAINNNNDSLWETFCSCHIDHELVSRTLLVHIQSSQPKTFNPLESCRIRGLLQSFETWNNKKLQYSHSIQFQQRQLCWSRRFASNTGSFLEVLRRRGVDDKRRARKGPTIRSNVGKLIFWQKVLIGARTDEELNML